MSFAAGQSVRVAARAHQGHHRTPGYLKGRIGVIERAHGSFLNPEQRAYGGDGLPRQTLYLVGFAAADHRVYADIFEHWLEEAG